jgi:hypothetical protein
MKKLELTLLMSLAVLILSSQTNFEGGIYSDTEWTVDNSPYIITGDIVLFPDKILTIQPGVEVKFNGHYFFEIRGILISIANDSSRIVYTSNLPNPDKGDWEGIKIKNNQGARASFEHCEFSYAENANNVECCGEGGPIYFKSCKFDNNYFALSGYTGYDIEVNNCEFTNNTYCITDADKTVKNSHFVGNEYGLFETERINVRKSIFQDNNIALFGGRGLVDSCLIENNNIGVKSFSEGFELRFNHITDNTIGIQLSNYNGYYPPVKNNIICNNSTYNVENTDDISKDLTENCWCISDSTAIESKLLDGYDNISLGLFNYDIYDEDCETILETVIKVDLTTGIYQADIKNIVNIFPNPFQSDLNIDFKSPDIKEFSISIYNLFGQEVYHSNYFVNNTSLSLGNLNSGMYVCSIQTETIIINKLIIKN